MKPLATLGALLLMMALASGTLFAQSGNDILKRIDTKLWPSDYEAYRYLVDQYPDGSKKEYTVYTVKKGADKIAMAFLAPASEVGRSLLRVGDNWWMYIPNVGRPIRITSLQSVTGSIFNNSDIMQVDYADEYNVAEVQATDSGFVLDLKAKDSSVAYDKLRMWATKDDIVTKIECYAASGMLIKTLDFLQIKDFGNGIVRPSVIQTTSPFYKGYVSFMIFISIRPRQLPDEVFTLSYMPRIEALQQ